jgi:hypothetical protein
MRMRATFTAGRESSMRQPRKRSISDERSSMVLSEQSIMEQQPTYFQKTSSSISQHKVAFDDDTTSATRDYAM